LSEEFELFCVDACFFDFAEGSEVDDLMVAFGSPLGDVEGGLETFGVGLVDFEKETCPLFFELLFSNDSLFD
jgi:hypothetical protein